MNHTNITYMDITKLAPYSGKYSLYTRLKIIDNESEYFNKIGELESYKDDIYYLNLPAKAVAGFSLNQTFDKICFRENQLSQLDYGLNSPFIIEIDKLVI